jgi:hypothetical protein
MPLHYKGHSVNCAPEEILLSVVRIVGETETKQICGQNIKCQWPRRFKDLDLHWEVAPRSCARTAYLLLVMAWSLSRQVLQCYVTPSSPVRLNTCKTRAFWCQSIYRVINKALLNIQLLPSQSPQPLSEEISCNFWNSRDRSVRHYKNLTLTRYIQFIFSHLTSPTTILILSFIYS